jgi:hypothetical protein
MQTQAASRGSVVAGLLLAALAGCGGTAPLTEDAGGRDHPAAAGGGGAGTTGAAGSSGGTRGGAGSDAGVDASDAADAADGFADGDAVDGSSDVGDGVSVDGGSARRLVAAHATLVGTGKDSCTNERGATGDRWCAFTKPSVNLGFDELWVIDVTRAAAGATIKCDGTDASCLRLTTGLFSEQTPSGTSFRIHGFDGDTLIYYAELDPTAQGSFVGPVYAWRPGWPKGHKLTGDTGVVCNGHPAKAVALCFEGADTSSTKGALFFEMHAGAIAATDTTTLPLVEKVLTSLDTDDPGLRKFQVDLSDDGNWLAWSARPAPAAAEALKVQKIGDNASRLNVATNVSRWTISPDVQKWYYLRNFNYDLNGAESGLLEMQTFPAGNDVATLASNVGDYSTAGVKGLLMRTGEAQFTGTLSYMADRDSPWTLQTFDTRVLGVIAQSTDGTAAVYTKDTSLDGLTDLYLRRTGMGVPCTLAAVTTAIPAADFLGNNGLAVWARFNELTNVIEGVSTSSADCRTSLFASNIASWAPAGDQTLVYEDEFAPDGSDKATLRLAAVTDAKVPKGAVIAAEASAVYAQLLPALPAVVYSVLAGTQADGLYIHLSVARP